MAIYAVLDERGKPIAYHNRKRVVVDYLCSLKRPGCTIAKSNHPKRIEQTLDYSDLYLTKVADFYVPAKYFDAADILVEDEIINYYSIIDIISRDLEFNEDLTKKERKALEKTLGFYQSRVYDIKETPIEESTLRHMSDIMHQYSTDVWTGE